MGVVSSFWSLDMYFAVALLSENLKTKNFDLLKTIYQKISAENKFKCIFLFVNLVNNKFVLILKF